MLSLITLFFTLPYPYTPAQLSLVNALTIGIPSFVLAMEPNENRISGKFMRNVIFRALPAALTDLVLVVGVMLFYLAFHIREEMLSTICTGIMGVVGLLMVYQTSQQAAQGDDDRPDGGVCPVLFLPAEPVYAQCAG